MGVEGSVGVDGIDTVALSELATIIGEGDCTSVAPMISAPLGDPGATISAISELELEDDAASRASSSCDAQGCKIGIIDVE